MQIDMESGWQTPSGYPPQILAKTLADTLDEVNRKGHRTLLMRYAPGAADDRVLVHDFVEEVWMLDGELTWLDRNGELVQRIPRNSYVCRPAGVRHGPFRSETGCLMLVCFYFADDDG